jgi:hypothetical protein
VAGLAGPDRQAGGQVGLAGAGSGGRYTGRNSPTRSRRIRIECAHPIRSAITMAGIVGNACSSSRIRGSTSSTSDHRSARSHRGAPSPRSAALTVFLDTPITRAITLIGIRSDRCKPADLRPILHSQHSLPLPDSTARDLGKGVNFPSPPWAGQMVRDSSG